jgi:hypothetical protein
LKAQAFAQGPLPFCLHGERKVIAADNAVERIALGCNIRLNRPITGKAPSSGAPLLCGGSAAIVAAAFEAKYSP